jgi:hypothetical protein
VKELHARLIEFATVVYLPVARVILTASRGGKRRLAGGTLSLKRQVPLDAMHVACEIAIFFMKLAWGCMISLPRNYVSLGHGRKGDPHFS